MRSRPVALLVAFVALGTLAVLTGLVRTPWGPDRSPQVLISGHITVLVAGDSPGASEAAIDGRLALTTDRCLGVAGDADADAQIPIALPAGSTVSSSSPLVLRIGSQSYRLGDRIQGGGGAITFGDAADMFPGADPRCTASEVFVMED